MKKLYSILCASALMFSFSANAATHNVLVGMTMSGTPSNVFTPSTISAAVGDVVNFVLGSGTHNVTSTSVPSGATAMSSGTMSTVGQTYTYNITHAGTYNYTCTFHSGMNGTIVATSVGIMEPATNLLTNAYPNPFKDKITVTYGAIESLEIFNIVGEKVKTIELVSGNEKVEIDLTALPSGVYFFRTYKDGNIVETKRIVKAK